MNYIEAIICAGIMAITTLGVVKSAVAVMHAVEALAAAGLIG